MLNPFHVHLIDHGISKKIVSYVNQKHFIIVFQPIHSKYRTTIDVNRIKVIDLSFSFLEYICLKIDVIATCFAQFSDGNINYMISRSVNQEKFICFVN